jgi:hypothetical protein
MSRAPGTTIDTTAETGIDPQLLLVASHELAHAIAFRIAGVDVYEIRVKGHGATAQGYVHVPDPDCGDVTTLRRYLAAVLAGNEASLRWCDENEFAFHHTSSSEDIDAVRQLRRTPTGKRIPYAAITADARRIVRSHWPAITRLAPVLARAGRISPSRLPR